MHYSINDEKQIFILNAENDTFECYFTTWFGNLPFFHWMIPMAILIHYQSEKKLESEVEGKESYGQWTMDSNSIQIHAYGLGLVPFLYAFVLKIHC